jgi:DNA-binding transcriptional MerR regulator
MTIKEIAELCGVEVHTVRNWINKDDFLRENFTLRNNIKKKLEDGSPECPSDYNLGEVLEIISEGGGNRTLAALLAENAVNTNAVKTANPFPMQRTEELIELMRQFKKRLEDPKEAAYKELEAFISRNLTPEPRSVFTVYA